MIASLLAFVLLPRQADRALSAAIAALPPLRDTLRLGANVSRADSARARAESQQRDALRLLAALTAGTDSLADRTMAPPATRDSLLLDLWQHLVRARTTPLVESYLALAAAPALQRDPERQRTVRALRDSIERLNRERETYAALSGPDALYAIMTVRLTRLGNALVRVAQSALPPAPAVVSPPDSTPAATAFLVDSSRTPLMERALLPDTLLDAMVRAAADSLALATQALDDARRFNDALERRKATLRARMQLHIPPLAMLLASLVLGLTSGFVVALWREMRRPTVGDAPELEQLTRSRVIVHARDEGHRFRRRTRKGEIAVPVLSPTDDAWPLLHLTLSHIGDMSRQIQLLADQPLVAGAVGLNVASVAARESRATILVDAAQRTGALIPLLPASSLATATGGRPVSISAHEYWDSARALPLGRDASVDLLLPRGTRAAQPRINEGIPTARITAEDHVRHYDFVVFVTDSLAAPAVPPDTDLVLCVRLGVTPLSWITRAVRTAEEQSRRVRAVVLWADTVPLAG